ncbi:MAG: BON domain-containing protein [Candidatus Binatia bacterium]
MYDQLKTIKGFGLMGKYTLWFPLLFGLTIILMGCEERGRQPRIGTPNPSIHKLEHLNASMRDSDLENAVRAKLENDPQLKSADLRVNGDGVRNEVTLSGTVPTHAARKKAIELAKSAKPGVLVNDKIDVKPAA